MLAVTAEFVIDLDVRETASGSLTSTIVSVNVQINEWYAQIADFFSGGALRKAVTSAIRAVMNDRTTGLGSLLDQGFGRSLGQLGTAGKVGLTTRRVAKEIQRNGFVIKGELNVSGEPGPHARLSIVRAADGLVIAYAMESWVPGGMVYEIRFDFGDGRVTTLTGDTMALVAQHAYGPGHHLLTCTVVDAGGRDATAEATVHVE